MLQALVGVLVVTGGLLILLALPVFAGWWKPFKGKRRGPHRWRIL